MLGKIYFVKFDYLFVKQIITFINQLNLAIKKIKVTHLFIFISIFFWNCNSEPYEQVPELDEASKVLFGINQKNTSLDEIKTDPYLNTLLQKALKNIKKQQNYAKKNSGVHSVELSNQIKKFSVNEYTSYTIPIINGFENLYIFQNLVIEKDILRDAVYLVTYYPYENYKESIRKIM